MNENYLKLNGQYVSKDSVEEFTDNNDLHKIEISLQSGPVKDHGVNGLQIDDIIIMVRDIISSFNKRFTCRENSLIITKLEEAKLWSDMRTCNRIKRGVEGQDKK